ncbi:MAG TPA: TatD family hydrolase [Planctomycetota bacterium]|jgi:hypothetical protein|nr:TatD family hydrolase [Planctomycetota bacterium]
MRIFEPHIHMISRVTDDYEAMALAGVRVVLEPAFWLGQPRRHAGTFFDYFDALLDFEARRAAEFGIEHYCALSLNPKEANDERLAAEVLKRLPEYLANERVLAVGEVGFDAITPAEEKALRAQIEIAASAKLPLLVHTPHRDKRRGTERTLEVVKEARFSPERVLIDHNTEETTPLARAAGCWAGHTVYPRTKLSAERFVNILDEHGLERMLVNSSADWGVSDPLNAAKSAREMRRRGYGEEKVDAVVWKNPVAFFSQSGRLRLDGR